MTRKWGSEWQQAGFLNISTSSIFTVMGLPQFQRAPFFIAVNPLAGKQKFPVNLVPIEFGAVNADELSCTSYRNTAAATHAGAIDHN
jgi:hypothetical protein